MPIGADEMGALVDTLIENVFAHTPAGTGYAIWAGPDGDDRVVLVVEDEGPGFPNEG
ncbi:MAG: two-component sensor histidine kinase, partial [Actinobacteria bacterium]|nr:two-component sensor histidine kinase [Actinomycetota bacterium]